MKSSEMREKPILVLVDGHALIHRAHHALPPLTVGKTGEVVSAVYGFARMLLKVMAELKPTYIAVAFDRAAPTFRHLQFEDYKAHRPKVSDDLINQFQRVRQLVEAFNIPTYELDGYEADDVLGTLCRQASEQGIDTVIVTGDADTIQLVSPKAKVLSPVRGFGETVLYDETAVMERYGLRPEQIPDLKGLTGDPTDNIPGIPGVGNKTAAKLLQEYGSIEEIYANIELIRPEKLRETLRSFVEQAKQSKDLATIITDVPISLDLEKCHIDSYDRAKVVELFHELEFKSLIDRLPPARTRETMVGRIGDGIMATMAAMEGDYKTVATSDALEDLLARLSSTDILAIDTETTDRDAMRAKLVGISLSPAPGEAYYIPVGHRNTLGGSEGVEQLPLEYVVERLRPVLASSNIAKIAHNAKYDMTVLAEHGLELRNLSFDTLIAAYLLNEKALGLKELAFEKLKVEMMPLTALIGKGAKQISVADVDILALSRYACADANMTFRLFPLLEAELKANSLSQLFTDVEMPLITVLLRMEQNGVALDTSVLREMSQVLSQEISKLEGEIYNLAGHNFNINSTQQLGAVLFGELKLLGLRKKMKTGYSTDAATLETLRGTHPIIDVLQQYRQLVKLRSTYIDALPALINPKTGRVHTSFNQTGTATGRLSSSEPNLQNIPIRTDLGRQVRRAFVARMQDGDEENSVLLAGDYSQIELRILAHFSQDPLLLNSFREDEDIHISTASQVFDVHPMAVTPEMRRVAKTINFAVIYGISDFGLSQGTGLSRSEAARFIAAYFEKYPGIRAYLDGTKRHVREWGYVESILGRRRYIPGINAANPQLRNAAERMAINMPVQGTAADIIKIAMNQIQRRMDAEGLRSRMILQVHDELIFECPREEVEEMKRLVCDIMPRALELSVPLKVDVKLGRNWGEME